MNPVVETMLKDLIEETEQHGPGAVYAVLSLLYGCCQSGRHNEFAKHCCEFSLIRLASSQTTVGQAAGGASGPKERVC